MAEEDALHLAETVIHQCSLGHKLQPWGCSDYSMLFSPILSLRENDFDKVDAVFDDTGVRAFTLLANADLNVDVILNRTGFRGGSTPERIES